MKGNPDGNERPWVGWKQNGNNEPKNLKDKWDDLRFGQPYRYGGRLMESDGPPLPPEGRTEATPIQLALARYLALFALVVSY